MVREEQADVEPERLGLLDGIDSCGPPFGDRGARAEDGLDRLRQQRLDLARDRRVVLVEDDADTKLLQLRVARRGKSPGVALLAEPSGPAVASSAVLRSAAERASGPTADMYVNSGGLAWVPGT